MSRPRGVRLHFGIIMPWAEYELLLKELTARGAFVIEHHIRFRIDPRTSDFFSAIICNNYLEFKAFRNMDMLFAKDLERY